MFLEQDDGLEALSSVIGRQKQMALDLGNEVDDQNGNDSGGRGPVNVHCRPSGDQFSRAAAASDTNRTSVNMLM